VHGNAERLHVIIGDSDEVINHRSITIPLLPPGFENLYTIRGGTHVLFVESEVEEIFKRVIAAPEETTDGDGEPRHIHHYGEKLP
jgi:hypothetical protein